MSSPTSATLFQNVNSTGMNVTNGKAEVTRFIAVNTTGATAFLQVFDAPITSVTLATTVPLMTIPIVATTGSYTWEAGRFPWLFDNQMSVASTTAGLGSTGSANGVFITVWVN